MKATVKLYNYKKISIIINYQLLIIYIYIYNTQIYEGNIFGRQQLNYTIINFCLCLPSDSNPASVLQPGPQLMPETAHLSITACNHVFKLGLIS